MLQPSRTLSNGLSWNWLVIPRVLAVILSLGAGGIHAQTVATYSFEDGTADGWSSFNGASTPVASNAAAHAGSYSLLTTTGATGARRSLDQSE